ncbi:MAG: M3 family oligoendopeptidase [Candidatus Poribacteria bacterium]|nr:M3 family oligoendopeptidase [Candidatus Poribacteria bacterium]
MKTEETGGLPSWDLSDLYSGIEAPELEKDLTSMTAQAAAFEQEYKGRIARSHVTADLLQSALAAYEKILQAQYKPGAFANLLFSTDTADSRRGALLQRTREVGSVAAKHLIFFELEIGNIPQDTFDCLISQPQLEPYRHYLQHQRELAKHNLSEAEEGILEETANTRGRAFERLFTEITSRQIFRLGEEELTQSELLARFHDPDRETRKAASTALTHKLKEGAHILTFIFNTLLHEKQVIDRLRGFSTAEAARHLDNEVDEAVVNMVVDVCVDNYGTVADYYRLKRELLGLDALTHYDRYAPITSKRTKFSFEEAKDIVLDAFGRFSPKLTAITEPFFSRRWIDAALRTGKQGGAYCAAITPDLHPYILMNYTGEPRDVMTLAHELGHGVHDVLASEQSLLNYYPVLPLAETASTFGEMLVFDALQAKLSSPQERLALLCGKVEDTFATVFRQIAMYRFEREVHRLRREQGEQPTEAYCELWQQTMQEMFGDSLTLGEEHQWWWLYIPHINQSPFYVYAYAFGELLVLSLYAKYHHEGGAFVPAYFELLRAGGSAPPAKLIADMGIDITSSDFWQGGCNLILEKVKQAKELAKTISVDNGRY